MMCRDNTSFKAHYDYIYNIKKRVSKTLFIGQITSNIFFICNCCFLTISTVIVKTYLLRRSKYYFVYILLFYEESLHMYRHLLWGTSTIHYLKQLLKHIKFSCSRSKKSKNSFVSEAYCDLRTMFNKMSIE
jgi:hypothetical protein